jgi:hypothetical protein
MANDRFLETQRVQKVEMDKIKKLLTTEQLQLLGEDPKDKKDTVELLTPPSPSSAKRFLNGKMNKGTNKKENIKARKSGLSEPRRSLASLVQRSPKSNSLPSTPSSILDVSTLLYLKLPPFAKHFSMFVSASYTFNCRYFHTRL